jgi:DNA-binding IclR family transcriptional regulator
MCAPRDSPSATGQISLDTLSVAAPVHARHGQVVATVSLVVRHGTALPHALAPLVRTSARAISRALTDAG